MKSASCMPFFDSAAPPLRGTHGDDSIFTFSHIIDLNDCTTLSPLLCSGTSPDQGRRVYNLIFDLYDSTAPHRFAEPPELRGAFPTTVFLIYPISTVSGFLSPPAYILHIIIRAASAAHLPDNPDNPDIPEIPDSKVLHLIVLFPNKKEAPLSLQGAHLHGPRTTGHDFQYSVSRKMSLISPLSTGFSPRLCTFLIKKRAASAAHLPESRTPHPEISKFSQSRRAVVRMTPENRSCLRTQ